MKDLFNSTKLIVINAIAFIAQSDKGLLSESPEERSAFAFSSVSIRKRQ